jgi:hypothetical protein
VGQLLFQTSGEQIMPATFQRVITVNEEAAELLSKKKKEASILLVVAYCGLFQISLSATNRHFGSVLSEDFIALLVIELGLFLAVKQLTNWRYNLALPLKHNILRNQGWDGIGPLPLWVPEPDGGQADLFDQVGSPIDWDKPQAQPV